MQKVRLIAVLQTRGWACPNEDLSGRGVGHVHNRSGPSHLHTDALYLIYNTCITDGGRRRPILGYVLRHP